MGIKKKRHKTKMTSVGSANVVGWSSFGWSGKQGTADWSNRDKSMNNAGFVKKTSSGRRFDEMRYRVNSNSMAHGSVKENEEVMRQAKEKGANRYDSESTIGSNSGTSGLLSTQAD